MAESINFNREQARHLIDCVANGKAIEGRLNHDDMMLLAGVCLFVARSHGALPHRLKEQGASSMAFDHLPAEYLVSTEEQFMEDSRAALDFYARLARLVHDGEYDASLEPQVSAFIHVENGENRVVPVRGFKIAPGTL